MRRSNTASGLLFSALLMTLPAAALLLAPGGVAAQEEDGEGAAASDESASAEPEAEAVPSAAPGAVEGAEAAQPAPIDLKTAEETYDIKIRDIEEKVNELKEKIFRSKARLLALQEAVISGVSSGARARIVHRNEMGSTFRLREIHYFIDGAPLRQEVDETGDSLSVKEEIELFSGNIVPGNHQITVNLVYQGHGFGIFSYLNGYVFRLKSSYTFRAEEGKETLVKVVAFEKGGITTALQERPAIRYDVMVKRQKGAKTEATEAAKNDTVSTN